MLTDLFLKSSEILGLNRRNQDYVRPYNSPRAKAIADSKIKTKQILENSGIKTTTTFHVIKTKTGLKNIDWNTLPKSFVLKPNFGTGGNGIIIFYGKKRNSLDWIRPNGQTMSPSAISLHIENIIDGRFAMGEKNDYAILEERIKNNPLLKQYSYKGVPDIRVIVFNRVPVMAELRLPTKESNGAANLHAGGIGVGIDIASGVTTVAIHRKKASIIEDSYELIDNTFDLDRNLPLRGITIPFWDEVLKISVQCQEISGLGYAGVDIAIDKEKGPLVLELNARPGLAIQIANMAGLRSRLERVKGLKINSIDHGIRVAKNLFGGEIEEEIEALSGKQVVNLVEKITLYPQGKSGVINKSKREHIKALLDTGITTSRIDRALAARMGYIDAIKAFNSLTIPSRFESYADADDFITSLENRDPVHKDILRFAKISEDGKIVVKPVIEIVIKIAGIEKRIESIISTQKEILYPILIGRRDLTNFLIDPSKTFVR